MSRFLNALYLRWVVLLEFLRELNPFNQDLRDGARCCFIVVREVTPEWRVAISRIRHIALGLGYEPRLRSCKPKRLARHWTKAVLAVAKLLRRLRISPALLKWTDPEMFRVSRALHYLATSEEEVNSSSVMLMETRSGELDSEEQQDLLRVWAWASDLNVQVICLSKLDNGPGLGNRFSREVQQELQYARISGREPGYQRLVNLEYQDTGDLVRQVARYLQYRAAQLHVIKTPRYSRRVSA